LRALLLILISISAYGAEDHSWVSADAIYSQREEKGALKKVLALIEEVPPKTPGRDWRLARVLVRFGEKAEGRKKKISFFEKAEEAAFRAVALDPDDPESHFWHAVSLGRRGEARGMMQSLFMIKPMKKRLARVLELDPRHDGALHARGELYRQLPGLLGGSKKKAVLDLEKALEYGPSHSSHYPALAQAYLDDGKEEEAYKVLERLFKIETPADLAAFKGHLEEARKMLKEAGRPVPNGLKEPKPSSASD